jgi:hypothetical protein
VKLSYNEGKKYCGHVRPASVLMCVLVVADGDCVLPQTVWYDSDCTSKTVLELVRTVLPQAKAVQRLPREEDISDIELVNIPWDDEKEGWFVKTSDSPQDKAKGALFFFDFE